MRRKTLEQILKVIEIADQHFTQNYGIDQCYQYGLNRVSQDYSVTYNTINDACVRRLDLDKGGKFKEMLQATLEGDPSNLRNLLIRKSPHLYHEQIIEFFSTYEKGKDSITTNISGTHQINPSNEGFFLYILSRVDFPVI